MSKKLSKKRHELHQEMWGFLTFNTDKEKDDWRKLDDFEKSDPVSWEQLCFACGEAYDRAERNSQLLLRDADGDIIWKRVCPYCPIEWEITNTCVEINSFFISWSDNKKYKNYAGTICNERVSELAEKIANLTWKDE